MANPCFRADVKKFDFTQDEIGDIWNYAKAAYIDKGIHPVDAIHGTARDLGLKPEWVLDAFTKPKAIRNVTNEMYRTMSLRRSAVNAAKSLVRSIDTPSWKKAVETVYRTPFAVAVGWHGTVGMQTHVGAKLFQPSTWNIYFKNFGRQFKYSTNRAAHEAAMNELVRKPNYDLAKRSGLANDPTRIYTDYGYYAQWLPKLLGREMGQRGFDTLKVYRQDAFDYEWSKVPAEVKADPRVALDYARQISEEINHSSGVIGNQEQGFIPNAAKFGHELLFAAKLEGSRWARIIGDPLKTVNTWLDWKRASAADRHVALRRTINAAEFTGFYFTTLLANDAIQKLAGQPGVNFTDPTKSDWLAHKVGNHTIWLEGRVLAPVRLLAQLASSLWFPKSYEKRDAPYIRAAKDVAQYARGKAAPAIGLATELATGEDYSGRPLPFPFSSKPGTAAKPKLSLGEYAFQHGPIPLSGAVREIYDTFREQGMSALQASTLLRGLAVFGTEMTGAKAYKTQPPKTPIGRLREPTEKEPRERSF